MGKYDPLQAHLRLNGSATVSMSFDEVAALVGSLPRSAFEYREWWANDEYHVQAAAWREAGYAVDAVNLVAGTVRFRKAGSG